MAGIPNLQRSHAAVTGAARGIGAQISYALAAEGASLPLPGRRRDALQALAAKLPSVGGTRRPRSS